MTILPIFVIMLKRDFMLIEDGKLNITEFKARYKEFDWVRVPRKLGPDHKDFFYITSFEDEDWKIQIKTRPSMRMSISESYKHCDIRGKKVSREYTKEKYDFGTSIEITITDSTLEEIKKIAKELPPIQSQELDL